MRMKTAIVIQDVRDVPVKLVLAHHAVQLLHRFWSVLLSESGDSPSNVLGCTFRIYQVEDCLVDYAFLVAKRS
jgi:hypothetical protein